MFLKQSTAVTIKLGPFVDETDGHTPETALTISQADVRLSKNGGGFAQKNNATAGTHDENGWYGIPLSTTDTNTLGVLQVAVNEAGALPVFVTYTVLAANVYDSLIGGGDTLDVTVPGGATSVDVANVGTAVSDAETNILSVVDSIDARIPAALVGGRMDSDVAILQAGVIDTAQFVAGAIDATVIGTNAIDADALANSAVSEIAAAFPTSSLATGTADSGTTTTMVDAARTEADTDYWKGAWIVFTSGNIAGQVRLITAFAPGTDTITFTPATTQAVAAQTYSIIPAGAVNVGTGGITAASFAAAAIDATAIASNAISNSKIANSAIGANQIATGAFTAAKFGASAIDAAALATDAVAEIASAVWESVRASHTTAGTFGQGAASVQGNVTGSVASIASGGLAAASIATAAANKIADHVLRRTYAEARASGDGSALNFRSLLGAMGKLVNRLQISAGVLTIYQEDDTTSTAPGGTQALTGTPGADPITEVDTT